jgi:alkylhydroperoxidase family enzyme
MSPQRIAPLDSPYAPETQKLFDLVMPPGVDPLKLFRTLATNRRVFPRFMRAGVLDRGPVEIRDRELVIHRTTALCQSEYEWGVHVNAFARPLGLSEEVIRATVTAPWDDPLWSPAQSALIRLCDELHDSSSISDPLWEELEGHFSHEQILELIYTVGVYHTVSFLTNGLRIELEAFGERFPDSPIPVSDCDARDGPQRERQLD